MKRKIINKKMAAVWMAGLVLILLSGCSCQGKDSVYGLSGNAAKESTAQSAGAADKESALTEKQTILEKETTKKSALEQKQAAENDNKKEESKAQEGTEGAFETKKENDNSQYSETQKGNDAASQSSTQQHSPVSSGESSGQSAAQEQKHVHNYEYSQSLSRAAGCTVNGVNVYVCSCGARCEETVQAKGHNYIEQTKSIWHEPVYKAVWVVDQEAVDYDQDIYETHNVCNCGFDFTANGYTEEQVGDHCGEHLMNREPSNYGIKQVVVGSRHIHFDEIGHTEMQLEKEGYYEQQKYYICSVCHEIMP